MGLSPSSHGHKRQGRNRLNAEINVTPFVDVMLVLLIIFMVAAPLLTVSVPVDLPESQAATSAQKEDPLVISINARGRIFLQESEIKTENLVAKLRAISNNKTDIRIFVRGDKNLSYGRIMEVMGLLSQAGFSKVALVATMPN